MASLRQNDLKDPFNPPKSIMICNNHANVFRYLFWMNYIDQNFATQNIIFGKRMTADQSRDMHKSWKIKTHHTIKCNGVIYTLSHCISAVMFALHGKM